MSTKLRVVHGAGRPYEVDAGTAAQYSGTTISVLQQLVEEHIHDPELLETLRDPRVALDQFSDEAGGEGHEQPLSPYASWADLVAKLQEADVEVGVAKSHAGGVHEPFAVGCVSRNQSLEVEGLW